VVSIGTTKVRIWDLNTGNYEKKFSIIPPMSYPVWYNAFDYDKQSNRLVWCGKDAKDDGCIWTYDLTTDSQNTFYGHTATVSCVKIRQRMIFSGSRDKTIRIWKITEKNIPSTTKELTGHSDEVCSLDIDLSKDIFVSGSFDNSIKVWKISSGDCLLTLYGHEDAVRTIEISSPFRYIVSGSRDKSIKIWDLDTGKLLRNLEGHSNWVCCLSVYGNIIVSGGCDKTLRIWNILNGQCEKIFNAHKDEVSSVHVANDIILSGSYYDCTVKVWRVNVDNLDYKVI